MTLALILGTVFMKLLVVDVVGRLTGLSMGLILSEINLTWEGSTVENRAA